MVRGAFLHLPGIGPIRAAHLQELGVRTWQDLGPHPPAGLRLGTASWELVRAAAARCDAAAAQDDIAFLARSLCGPDLWRLLAAYGQRAAFVDIETDGLHRDAQITVIACYGPGGLRTFVRGENLDEFLDLACEIELMVTFNGTSFDVPMLRHGFHIPELPCPHLDLRWACYHAGWRGGLKSVEAQVGLRRPPDVQGVDGALAVDLWERWQQQGERQDRDVLVRYCAADTVALRGVAAALLRHRGCACDWPCGDSLWLDLDAALPPVPAGCRLPAPREAAPGTASATPPLTPRPANTEAAARSRLRELLQRRFAQGG